MDFFPKQILQRHIFAKMTQVQFWLVKVESLAVNLNLLSFMHTLTCDDKNYMLMHLEGTRLKKSHLQYFECETSVKASPKY